MAPAGPPFAPDHDTSLPTPSLSSSAAAADLFLIDLGQGVATGGCFYLLAVSIVRSTTPPSMVLLMCACLIWCAISAWRLQWREAALGFGVVVGVSANLFAPILLFLLFLAAWARADKALTLPWIAIGLASFACLAGRLDPSMLAELHRPQLETLFTYYLIPLAFGALSCATLSQFTVAVARTASLDRSLRLLNAQWLSVGSVVLAVTAIGQAIVRCASLA